MHKLHERPVKDLFRHGATSWIDLVHQLDALIYGLASGSPAVIMVQPTQDRCGDDRPTAPRHTVGWRHAYRHLLVDALMRPGAIEVGDVGPQRPA